MSNFPLTFDTDQNLFLVHDALRVILADDYNPGDTSVTVIDENNVLPNFPPSGYITLTDQCSDINQRALTFSYNSVDTVNFIIGGLVLEPNYIDNTKPANLTDVTMNVVAPHHNAIKDALIQIEQYLGTYGTTDLTTIEGRLNYLRKVVFTPRAWFSVNTRLGIVPLSVEFKDESFRLGCGAVEYIWNFGDQTISNISFTTIQETNSVPIDDINVLVETDNLAGGTVQKTYTEPGNYEVSLTVRNSFGEDTVVFTNLVNARVAAPDEAVIEYIPRTSQVLTPGTPTGGPYITPPIIRSPVDTPIDITISSGVNPETGETFAGESVVDGVPIDPIQKYTWALGDDLNHPSESFTTASYSIGGLYDLRLRVDTKFQSFRITTYQNSISIIENVNLWLWVFNGASTVVANEFGLISETFASANSTLSVSADNSFLNGTNNEVQAKREFARNTGFAPRGTTTSGVGGTAMLYWASGGSVLANQQANVSEYNGFDDTYTSHIAIANRPWNWTVLSSNTSSYFLFGEDPSAQLPEQNKSYQTMTSYSLASLATANTSLLTSNYLNGADELIEQVSVYDDSGIPENGYFAVYRSAWKDQSGYVVRNDSAGIFFRLKSFYQTQGTSGTPVQNIAKLNDMPGTKLEGELVPMSNGVFFFTNGGSIAAYNDISGVWETGGATVGTSTFRSLQDTSVEGFDDLSNTLLAASDGDRLAYLSFDYSTNVFVKFNGSDLTFSQMPARPAGTQWQIGVW